MFLFQFSQSCIFFHRADPGCTSNADSRNTVGPSVVQSRFLRAEYSLGLRYACIKRYLDVSFDNRHRESGPSLTPVRPSIRHRVWHSPRVPVGPSATPFDAVLDQFWQLFRTVTSILTRRDKRFGGGQIRANDRSVLLSRRA